MHGSRVLVIDDSTTLRKLVEIAMRGTGCKVDFAANGSDGVSCARANRPDVILLDYLLPDLRSAEVCQRLRDDTATSTVPVVIMSANQRSVLDDFRTFSSVVGFIGKPFTPAEIRSHLEGIVRRGELAVRPARQDNAATIAVGSTADHEPPAASQALQLRGDLAATPLLEVLRLLAASHATGMVILDLPELGSPGEHAAPARIWLRRGDILLCSDARLDAPARGDLTPELHQRLTRNLATGKPVLVTLEEAGVTRVTNLPLELHVASVRILGELLDARSGRFSWEPVAALPDFVEAFGRSVSLTAVALEHSRRATGEPRSPGVLEHVYDRTPSFSDKVSAARLTAEERRVLAVLDGRTSGREIAARARLPLDLGAAILTRLCAAGLIRCDLAPRSVTARTLAVLDPDGDELGAALRARSGRGSPPIAVIALDPMRSLAAATLEACPAVLLVSAAALTEHVLTHELPIIARDTTITMVCVLDSPNPALATQMLRAGLHAVISKPIHLTEIERLLSG